MKQVSFWLLIAIVVLIGGFFRFYKLDWGEGLFTHPDEYHIVASVSQLSFPEQMHPHFFSYGTVTIYLIYFTQEIIKYLYSIFNFQFSISNSFLIGRFYSALFSTLSVLLVFKISSLFLGKYWPHLAAFLVALTPGLIQQAHFATPESNLTFFLLGSLLFLIKFFQYGKISYILLASIFLGLSLGVKISAIVFLLPLLIGIALKSFKKPNRLFTLTITSLFIVIITFFLVAPFVFLDFPSFRGNSYYEGGIATGKFPVFYTRQFIDTSPIIFQLEKILPYALGPTILLFGMLGLLEIISSSIKKPQIKLLLLFLAFLLLFLLNAFLFAKWTRFIAPIFPFFAIFSSIFLYRISLRNSLLAYVFTGFLLLTTFAWTAAFFSIYIREDIRVTTSNWIESNLPKNSIILIEGGNMVDIPLNGGFQKISLDFYNLEEDPTARMKIVEGLDQSTYFIIQSRRIFMNHQRLPDKFPKTAKFYNKLFSGQLGFEEVQKFTSYPRLEIGNLKMEFPDEKAEETWSVFDHPVIRIFKKAKPLTREDYAKFLEG